MAQYAIHKNRNINTKKLYPYLIVVQSPLLDVLETRMVIPVTEKENFDGKSMTNLNPLIEIEGRECIIQTQQMASIHHNNLGTQIGDASSKRNEILASIDFLITGF
jgi:toxin CcdB